MSNVRPLASIAGLLVILAACGGGGSGDGAPREATADRGKAVVLASDEAAPAPLSSASAAALSAGKTALIREIDTFVSEMEIRAAAGTLVNAEAPALVARWSELAQRSRETLRLPPSASREQGLEDSAKGLRRVEGHFRSLGFFDAPAVPATAAPVTVVPAKQPPVPSKVAPAAAPAVQAVPANSAAPVAPKAPAEPAAPAAPAEPAPAEPTAPAEPATTEPAR